MTGCMRNLRTEALNFILLSERIEAFYHKTSKYYAYKLPLGLYSVGKRVLVSVSGVLPSSSSKISSTWRRNEHYNLVVLARELLAALTRT